MSRLEKEEEDERKEIAERYACGRGGEEASSVLDRCREVLFSESLSSREWVKPITTTADELAEAADDGLDQERQRMGDKSQLTRSACDRRTTEDPEKPDGMAASSVEGGASRRGWLPRQLLSGGCVGVKIPRAVRVPTAVPLAVCRG